jgi:hypothetical protein
VIPYVAVGPIVTAGRSISRWRFGKALGPWAIGGSIERWRVGTSGS